MPGLPRSEGSSREGSQAYPSWGWEKKEAENQTGLAGVDWVWGGAWRPEGVGERR